MCGSCRNVPSAAQKYGKGVSSNRADAIGRLHAAFLIPQVNARVEHDSRKPTASECLVQEACTAMSFNRQRVSGPDRSARHASLER